MPHRMTPSWGFRLGVVLILLGLAGGFFFIRAMAAIGGQPLAASDLAYFVAASFSAVVLPLGLLLLPCAWILRIIEERQPQRLTDSAIRQ